MYEYLVAQLVSYQKAKINGFINEKRLKLICDFAYISEQILHGRPSGIDNTASTYGGLIEFHNSKVCNDNNWKNHSKNKNITSKKDH